MTTPGPRRAPSASSVAVFAVLALLGGAFWGLLSGWFGGRPAVARTGREPPLRVERSTGSPLSAPTFALPDLGVVPDFQLKASDGARVGRADLDGRPWAVEFIFTTCAGQCPLMSAQLARLQQAIPEGSRARIISITVDPGHDTPEVLRGYAARFGARPERWLLLTGDATEIYRLAAEGFHLGAGVNPAPRPPGGDGPFFHSSRVVLVDGEGHIRSYYEGTDPANIDRLGRDLRRLGPGT